LAIAQFSETESRRVVGAGLTRLKLSGVMSLSKC
jgi:hypothetical protein